MPLGLVRLDQRVRWWHISALALATLSLSFNRGALAGTLACTWLVAAAATLILGRRSPLPVLVTLVWLPAAAGWLVADRFGFSLFGFGTSTVQLTAAHFHQAGFGVSALLRLAGARRSLAIHQFGMIAVAAGINFGNQLQPVGAGLIIVALVGYALAALRSARGHSGWRRICLSVSALSWTYPMLLAFSWALAPFGHAIVIRTLDAMVAQHASVNAVALVFVGLVGFTPNATPRLSAKDRHALAAHT